MEHLADGLKGGAKAFDDNAAIGKSNALMMAYQTFDGKSFQATYDVIVIGFDGRVLLIGNTNLKIKDCREVTIHYSFKHIFGTC